MDALAQQTISKVPVATLAFGAIKVLASTLSETGDDAVTMTLELSYLAGLDKPVAHGGLALGRFKAPAVLAPQIIGCLLLIPQRAGRHPGSERVVR